MRRLLSLLLALAACSGGSGPCAQLNMCQCYARSSDCRMVTEACWCASECDARIACICGGGAFLRCESK